MPGAGEQPGQAVPSLRVGGQVGASQDQGASHGAGTRDAASLLLKLVVRSEATHSGYAREQFGSAWLDVDKNGCDTRDDILQRDLMELRLEKSARPCVVERGRLLDPYTNKDIEFVRGRGASVDIDHVVALGDAWATGAATWEPGKRIALANDPLNLLAVDASANRAKGSQSAATWLPPNVAYHCAYVARQIAVKAKYGLTLTAEERGAMDSVLVRCPQQVAPEGDAPTYAPIEMATKHHADAPARETTTRREPKPAPPASPESRTQDPDYGTCKEAKAHGAGPYRRGVDPEYAYYRDADGDGVVCE